MDKNPLLELGPEGEFERKRISRLLKIQRSDKAFFLLASHSYIESWLRQTLHMWDEQHSFRDLIFKFKIDLIENSKSFPQTLSVLQTLAAKEKTAEDIKQHFSDISDEEASAAAYRLLQFCRLGGIKAEEELKQIGEVLKIWEDRSLIPDDEITMLHQKLSAASAKNRDLLKEIEELRLYKSRIKELEAELASIKQQNIGGQAAELVKRMAELEEHKNTEQEKISSLKTADDYILNLERLTSYTRTRFDFERDVTRLTEEQQDVLDSISLKSDFLVKGGAGTGKTLVLIKSLEKALRLSGNELDFDDEPLRISMLTYNRTLAKYDRYLAELLKQEEDKTRIETIDKFLYDRLKRIDADYRIVFEDHFITDLLSEQLPDAAADQIKAYATEIDGLIYASDLPENEYISSTSNFKKTEREYIWQLSLKLAATMKKLKSFTKNFSRRVILDNLNSNICDTDFAFIDEVQDLSAADIKTVKACTKRAVIMAGDSDQAIYQSGFSFTRSGVDIRGTTKILKTNFRNSMEIELLSSAFADRVEPASAFRIGPPPELYRAEDQNALNELIIKRVKLFLNELCYDPENLCILVPSSRDIEPLQNRLKKAGFDSHDLRADEFSFKSRGVIRISTMHSSKGLDFPVVLLNLHSPPQTAAKTPDEQNQLRRNLIYVSMTRAMDQLNVFTLNNEKDPLIRKLTDAFSSH